MIEAIHDSSHISSRPSTALQRSQTVPTRGSSRSRSTTLGGRPSVTRSGSGSFLAPLAEVLEEGGDEAAAPAAAATASGVARVALPANGASSSVEPLEEWTLEGSLEMDLEPSAGLNFAAAAAEAAGEAAAEAQGVAGGGRALQGAAAAGPTAGTEHVAAALNQVLNDIGEGLAHLGSGLATAGKMSRAHLTSGLATAGKALGAPVDNAAIYESLIVAAERRDARARQQLQLEAQGQEPKGVSPHTLLRRRRHEPVQREQSMSGSAATQPAPTPPIPVPQPPAAGASLHSMHRGSLPISPFESASASGDPPQHPGVIIRGISLPAGSAGSARSGAAGPLGNTAERAKVWEEMRAKTARNKVPGVRFVQVRTAARVWALLCSMHTRRSSRACAHPKPPPPLRMRVRVCSSRQAMRSPLQTRRRANSACSWRAVGGSMLRLGRRGHSGGPLASQAAARPSCGPPKLQARSAPLPAGTIEVQYVARLKLSLPQHLSSDGDSYDGGSGDNGDDDGSSDDSSASGDSQAEAQLRRRDTLARDVEALKLGAWALAGFCRVCRCRMGGDLMVFSVALAVRQGAPALAPPHTRVSPPRFLRRQVVAAQGQEPAGVPFAQADCEPRAVARGAAAGVGQLPGRGKPADRGTWA